MVHHGAEREESVVLDVYVGESLDCVQLVAPDGAPVVQHRYDPERGLDRLASLYEAMVLTRGLDEEYINLQRQGQLALFPSCRGQEAAQVGCAAALRDTDWLFPQYRELGCFVWRGVDPAGIGHYWRGASAGGFGFLERAIAPLSIPVGTHALHAVGAAMATSWLDDGGLAVAFVGDGATSEGDFHEALNLAAVRDAPCIFYVQNNQWAISTPLAEQLRAPSIAHRASGYGMPGVRVDGNDVLACLVVVEEAADRARAGGGPTLVEAVTYRMGAHTTSDDPTRYRDAADVDAWKARDPIDRTRRHLERLGRWDETREGNARDRVAAAREQLRAAVYDARDPSPLDLFDHVFRTPTPDLAAQRTFLAGELEREGP
jgi:pyruvate dehydrogenase E1 component alpha subunit